MGDGSDIRIRKGEFSAHISEKACAKCEAKNGALASKGTEVIFKGTVENNSKSAMEIVADTAADPTNQKKNIGYPYAVIIRHTCEETARLLNKACDELKKNNRIVVSR